MRFTDNCLLLIATVLKNEGYDADEPAIEAALTEMFEGKRPPAKALDEYDLRPGEVYVVRDEENRDYSEEYSTRASLNEILEGYAQECADDRRDLDDRIKVFIKRCEVPIRGDTKVTVTIG